MAARTAHKEETGPEFLKDIELSSAKLGSKIVFATDEWFAAAENLLKPEEPQWKEGVYTPQGKWMDGWESARKRTKGHDWCIIQLGVAGVIRGVEIDTAYFTGNFVPQISLQAASNVVVPRDLQNWKSETGNRAQEADFILVNELKSETWETILPMTPLKPGYADTSKMFFEIKSDKTYSHIRVNYHPDGGVARLRLFGRIVQDWTQWQNLDKPIDLLAVEHGGVAIGWSDMHYGHPKNLINPGRGINMGDGWETARKPYRPAVIVEGSDGHLVLPGDDWSVLQLGIPGRITRIEVDTLHFKGNFPDSCKIEGCIGKFEADPKRGITKEACEALGKWVVLLDRTKCEANARKLFTVNVPETITHVRLTIYPDGGVSRLRCWGFPDEKFLQEQVKRSTPKL